MSKFLPTEFNLDQNRPNFRTLAPDELCRACTYRNRTGLKKTPVWKDAPNGKQYFPSYNVAPTSYTPVLISGKHHAADFNDGADRILQPMKWGLIPSWHKGPNPKVEYETNNCRAEGMLQKSTYKVPLERGRRCVILADGFYEWKRRDGAKQPYFIYFPQNDSCSQSEFNKEICDTDKIVKNEPVELVQCNSINTCENNAVSSLDKSNEGEIDCEKVKKEQSQKVLENSSTQEWTGKKLLTMAGVFDVWRPPDGAAPLYSYSVITVESSPAMSWIHHRMPAILTEEEVDDWLNYGEVPLSKAVSLIRPTENIQSHPVSSAVNNVRNKTSDLMEPVDLKKKKAPENKIMANWLTKGRNDKLEASPKSQKVETQQMHKTKQPNLMMKWLVKSEKRENAEDYSETPSKKVKTS